MDRGNEQMDENMRMRMDAATVRAMELSAWASRGKDNAPVICDEDNRLQF